MTKNSTPSGGNGTPVDGKATAIVHSYVEREHHAVISRGNFEQLYQGYLAHAATIGPMPEAFSLDSMRYAMAMATLQLALWPPDQHASFTLNFSEPLINIFLAGDNHEFQITGRVYSENVKNTGVSRFYVETQRPNHKPAQSVVDFDEAHALSAFEHYYKRGVQMRVRIFELEEHDFVMIQGLPIVERQWLSDLTSEDVIEMFDQGLEEIEQRTYTFQCGCNLPRIKKVVSDVFKSDPSELFGEEKHVEVQCPRCGKFWLITKEYFDSSPS